MKRAVFFLLTSCLTLAFSAWGQFPAKPVRLVVPSSPGGGIDSTTRAVRADTQKWGRLVRERNIKIGQ